MSPIRLGVIGLSATKGWAASSLTPPLFEAPLTEAYDLRAICTFSEASAAASKEKYSAIVGHSLNAYHGKNGPTEISNDPDVDFVVISVKAPEHKAAALKVIEAGKDFFVEWPAGAGLAETEEIAAAAKAKGLKTMVGTQARNSVVLDKASGLKFDLKSPTKSTAGPRDHPSWQDRSRHIDNSFWEHS